MEPLAVSSQYPELERVGWGTDEPEPKMISFISMILAVPPFAMRPSHVRATDTA